jgi:hypothetical protein
MESSQSFEPLEDASETGGQNPMNSQLNDMVLRADRPTDEPALRRLAALDSVRPLRGRALVAEVQGRPVAAIGLDDARVVADPFEHTADVVEMLRLRAGRLDAKPEHGSRLFARFRAAAA